MPRQVRDKTTAQMSASSTGSVASAKASKKTFNAYKSLSEAIAEHKARSETKSATAQSVLISAHDIGENDVLFGRGTFTSSLS